MLVRRRPAMWNRLAGVGAPVLAVAVLCWGGAMVGAIRWKEARETSRLTAAIPGAPNVLLLVLDTVRGHNMSLYGYSRPTTPAIDRIAGEGATFEWAFSSAPWTLPSHAAMFTGRWPWTLSSSFLTRLDGQYPTIAEELRDRGYLTAGFAANHIYGTYETGLARGFIRFEDYRLTPRQIGLSSELGQMLSGKRSGLAIRSVHRSYAPTVNRQFLDWLPEPGGRPFFAFLNYMDAHVPYGTPPEWEQRFVADPDPRVNRYDAALAALDSQLGVLFDSLTARGVLNNTVVIVTSDHGEHLGDHGIDDHANSLYAQLLRVPLVVRFPGRVPNGRRIDQAVSTIDLAPTILDLAGLPANPGFVGRSLRRFWDGPGVIGDSVMFAQVDRSPLPKSWFRNHEGPLWSLLTQDYHLTLNPDSTKELFRYRIDPAEVRDLAPDSTHAALIRRLQWQLDERRAGHFLRGQTRGGGQ
jgi:arylsulfatase A-like enzyme